MFGHINLKEISRNVEGLDITHNLYGAFGHGSSKNLNMVFKFNKRIPNKANYYYQVIDHGKEVLKTLSLKKAVERINSI